MLTDTAFPAVVVTPSRDRNRRARRLADLETEQTVTRLFREATSLVGFATADRLFTEARLTTDETWNGKDTIAAELVADLYDRTMRTTGGRP